MTRWNLRDLIISYDYIGDSLVINLRATARSVETGEDGPLLQRRVISRYEMEPLNPEQKQDLLRHYIRHMLVDMLLHELDECLYLNGKRLCKEPHP